MSIPKANRIDPRSHSIPLLPMFTLLVLVAGLCTVTYLHAQTAAKSDPAAATEARKGAAPKQKPAAELSGALTYDELGATPAVKPPKKLEPSKKPAMPTEGKSKP